MTDPTFTDFIKGHIAAIAYRVMLWALDMTEDEYTESLQRGRQMTTKYIYSWGNNEKRATMKGRICRLLKTLPMNSVIVEFEDNGQREITSRRALRKVTP